MNAPARRTVLQELDESDGLQGLTSKQYAFAINVFQGANYSDAYRQAYPDQNMKPEILSRVASALADHPLVVAKIRELRTRVESQSTLSAFLSRDLVLNGLLRLATGAQKESVQLGAYIALGKVTGIDLFREIHVTEKVTRTPEDVDRELLEHINKLKPVLEGKARDVTDAPKIEPAGAGKRDRRRKPSV
jgi:hypothetical protein